MEADGMAQWRKGRGKLGMFEPLIGSWSATTETPMGNMRCERSFERFGSAYVRLRADWHMGPKGTYSEIAIFGTGDSGDLAFWSFASDGKRSEGVVADVTDLHPEAIGFEAQMPAGLARQAYWPTEDGEGFTWVGIAS
jgi:hypothetical protein